MSGSESADEHGPVGAVLLGLLDTVWTSVVIADVSWNPEKSCYDLAREYALNGRTPTQNAENFIDWQIAKAGGAGFLLGLPGLAFGVVTIPADLATTTYLQLRMIAVIALLHDWDIKSDRLRTLAFLSMIGSSAGEVLRTAGVEVGVKLTAAMLNKIPGRLLIEINKQVGFRFVTKAGSKGVVNLTKFVPVFGGLVSGGLNALSTRAIGGFAHGILKEGPGQSEIDETFTSEVAV